MEASQQSCWKPDDSGYVHAREKDSGIGIKRCVQYALEHFNINENDDDKLRLFIGPPLFDSFTKRYGLTEEQANKAIELYRVRYREKGIFENRLYEGIKNLLEKLKEEGYILAVASSKPEVFVQKILTYFEIDKYFTAITGASLDGKLSAKKDVILKALEQLNATDKKDQCIMIGDNFERDIKGALNAGLKAIYYNPKNNVAKNENREYYTILKLDELTELL